MQDFEDAALCSVVGPLTELWKGMLAEFLDREPLVLHQRMNLGLKLDVRNAEQVGMDRLVDAVAVRGRTPGAAVAVDFGTATTFNVVDADGRFRGGAIAPGLATAAESLMGSAPVLLDLAREVGDQTSVSTGVELIPPPSAIGRDTDEALRSGIVLGYVGLVEGLLARIGDELDYAHFGHLHWGTWPRSHPADRRHRPLRSLANVGRNPQCVPAQCQKGLKFSRLSGSQSWLPYSSILR